MGCWDFRNIGFAGNEKEKQIIRLLECCGVDFCQFHGSEAGTISMEYRPKYVGEYNSSYKPIELFGIVNRLFGSTFIYYETEEGNNTSDYYYRYEEIYNPILQVIYVGEKNYCYGEDEAFETNVYELIKAECEESARKHNVSIKWDTWNHPSGEEFESICETILDNHGGIEGLGKKEETKKIGSIEIKAVSLQEIIEEAHQRGYEDIIELINKEFIAEEDTNFSFDASVKTIIQNQLNSIGNDIEVQGTQYEGRIERIEQIKEGDLLRLVREPDNKYDPKAIDIRSSSGSVGHVPTYVSEFLSPALDCGEIEAVARVLLVEPLSMRSKKAKKPLLRVAILICDSETENNSLKETVKRDDNESVNSTKDDTVHSTGDNLSSNVKDELGLGNNSIDFETSLHNVPFYMDKEVCSWLFDEAGGKEQTKVRMQFCDDDNFSYDIIDMPFHCEIRVKEGNIELLLYIRTVFGIYKEENANIHIIYHGNGKKPTLRRQNGIGGDVAQTIIYCLKTAAQLRKHISDTISENLANINPEKEGVLVKLIDNDIVFKRVSGRKRPSMLCNSLFEGMHMDRPYLDEQTRALAREKLSMKVKISLAQQGDPDCMEAVAQAYLNGTDEIVQDFSKAAYWWQKLAETGDASAQFNTGLFYAKGCGVVRDFKIAAEWMKKAADNGDDDAADIVKNYEKAEENLKKAENGDAEAQAEIAKFYTILGGSLEQFNTDSDYEEAFKWAKKSADQGNPDGLYCLALCYEHGRGTEIDIEKATQAYKKAADMRHAPSQWNLACQYLRGFSTGHEVEGLILAYESAEQGYELAINGLEQSGNTIEKIIESYEDPERIIILEETQYEGRADRCESMKAGDELSYKIAKDRNGIDAIELFFKGASVGFAYQHSVGKIIALLKMKKVELKVTVRTCIPKSKRGPRARNADVTLNMILTEIRDETPEEREDRLAREAVRRKEAEEKARIKAEKRKAEEEARKKAEEEAKEKRRRRAESGALELAKEARRSYKRLEETWQDRIEEHQNRASSKTFSSIDEVIRDMRRIVLDRDRYGTKYDDLIKDVDRRGREYVKDGCSSIAVNAIRDAIAEIIDESSALDIDFSTTGVSTEEIGSTKFEVSQSSKSIQKWWNSKYENMPEVQAEKRKKRLTDDLRTAQQVVTEAKKERSELDLKEKTLEQDISLSEHIVEDLESGFDASKSRIESDLTTILQGLQEKIDALKAEKAATEKNISDMQAQIAGLSLFKFGLKKDLTQKVESARAELPRFTEDIRRIEAEYEEAKRKCSSDIDSLQKKIEDEKRTLSGKKSELAALPDKKMELDAKVEAAIKQVEDLKKRIENL